VWLRALRGEAEHAVEPLRGKNCLDCLVLCIVECLLVAVKPSADRLMFGRRGRQSKSSAFSTIG